MNWADVVSFTLVDETAMSTLKISFGFLCFLKNNGKAQLVLPRSSVFRFLMWADGLVCDCVRSNPIYSEVCIQCPLG